MKTQKVKIEKSLVERARVAAEKAGYSGVEELIGHAVEKAIADIEGIGEEAEVKEKLKGLGYL